MISNKNVFQVTNVMLTSQIAAFLKEKERDEINFNDIFYSTNKIWNKIIF